MNATCLNGRYRLSLDAQEMNVDDVYQMLLRSHWGGNRTREMVAKSIDNSVCVGVFQDNQQVGIARAITDSTIFAYVLDVYVDDAHRGKGLSKQMMTALLAHPELKDVKYWRLVTASAHGLYEKFGFTAPRQPEKDMELVQQDA